MTAEQKKGAVDPMSAITTLLAGVKADEKNPCGTGVQVFDGRRRYDVTWVSCVKDEEPVETRQRRLGSGTAHQCQIHYNQLAGYKQKIVKEGKALPPMFIDVADVTAPGAPNGHFVIPIKLWSALSWGTVTATVASFKVILDRTSHAHSPGLEHGDKELVAVGDAFFVARLGGMFT